VLADQTFKAHAAGSPKQVWPISPCSNGLTKMPLACPWRRAAAPSSFVPGSNAHYAGLAVAARERDLSKVHRQRRGIVCVIGPSVSDQSKHWIKIKNCQHQAMDRVMESFR
jgi:hypothetical protein